MDAYVIRDKFGRILRPQTEEEREITKRVRERFHKRMKEVGARFMNDNERLEAIRRLLKAEERAALECAVKALDFGANVGLMLPSDKEKKKRVLVHAATLRKMLEEE